MATKNRRGQARDGGSNRSDKTVSEPAKKLAATDAKAAKAGKTDRPKIALSPMQVFAAEERAGQLALRASFADGFENFLSRVGANSDNTFSAGTYDFNLVTRNPVKLEAAYRGSWVVGVLIDCIAEDMTRAGVKVSTNEADEDLKDLRSKISKLQIAQSLASLIKWGRLYGGAIGVFQVKGQKLDTPLETETVAQGQFQGITVFDRWQVNPAMDDIIREGPEMGLPRFYDVILNPVIQAAATKVENNAPTQGNLRVHHSRVIRYTGIDLPYRQAITESYWGESILERLWDRLLSFDNATLSGANLIDKANLRAVGIEGLREIISAGGDALAGLVEQFDMMRKLQTNEGLTLLDKNDTYTTTQYTFAGLSDVILQFAQQLSGGAGVPLVRFLGQSPAGLSATGEADIRMYYDNINSIQESRLRNSWDKLLRILWRSTFGKPEPKDLDFNFVPLWQMSATEKSTIAKGNAETIVGAYESQLLKKSTAMKELRDTSGDGGLFGNISDEDIAEAEEQDDEPPLPGETDPGLEPGNTGLPDDTGQADKKPEPGPLPKARNRIADWLAKQKG